MSTFTLAISYLTTANLPSFVDLTFQVPMQYCSVQHRILLLSPVTSTAGYCFCFGSIPSFFRELFLHWSPVAYWAPTDLESSSFSILSFCLFILFMGFSRQEYWNGFSGPFSSGPHSVRALHHDPPILVALQAWLGFVELDKAVVLVWLVWLDFCEYGFSVSTLWCPLATPTILLGFSYLGLGVSLHGCSSKAQLLLLTLNEGYFLAATITDLRHGIDIQKRYPFHYRGLEWKSWKSRNTWSNRQIWAWNAEWSSPKTNRDLPRKCTGHSKHPLPTTQEKTLHMDIIRW